MLAKQKGVSALSSAIAGLGLFFLMTSPSFAANASQEIATAIQHLKLAAAAKDVKTVHMHMHHAINCLVGPKGWGFDASQINPCSGQGNGAIPDTTDKAKKQALQSVMEQIVSGLSDTDLGMAQTDAKNDAANLAKLK